MFIHIKLRGVLGKKFGAVHKCVAANVNQAIRYLDVNYSNFRDWVLEAQERGIVFKVKTNNYELGEDELLDPLPEDFTIEIIPLFAGSGNTFKIIAGIALIGLGIFTGGFLGFSGLQLIITGSLLLLSGLMGGRTDKPPDQENQRSFVFSGSSNTGSSGSRVMVVYGKILTGSLVLSAAVRSFITA
jgi:predicted phage tail protein